MTKLYVVDKVKKGEHYLVECHWGKIGTNFDTLVKHTENTLEEATKKELKIIKAKKTGESKYTEYVGAISGLPVTAAKGDVDLAVATTVSIKESAKAEHCLPAELQPMLSTAITDEVELSRLIADNGFVFQRKYDGVRCIIKFEATDTLCMVQGFNRKGESIVLTEKVDALFRQIGESRVGVSYFDGELMGDTYAIFDCLMLYGNYLGEKSFQERLKQLESFLGSQEMRVRQALAPTAKGKIQKQKMVEEARAQNWEGVILRNNSSGYLAGARSKDVLKFKFWDSATCRVLGVNDKRSVQLGLLQHGLLVNVGNCTVPANQIIPSVDTLVEVRYLYVHDGGSLFQPTLICVRSDKDLPDDRTTLRMTPPEKRGAIVV